MAAAFINTPLCCAAGGWGPRRPGMPAMPIPNKAVHFINNLLVNPDGYSASAFFNVSACVLGTALCTCIAVHQASALNQSTYACDIHVQQKRGGYSASAFLNVCVHTSAEIHLVQLKAHRRSWCTEQRCNLMTADAWQSVHRAGLTALIPSNSSFDSLHTT